MRGPKTTKLWALGMVAVLSFMACGEDEPTPVVQPSPTPVESATSGPAPVSAETYVSSLCTSMQAWITGLQEGQAQVEASVEPGNAESGKQALAVFFDGAVTGTDTLITSVEGIGVPDVEGGDEIAATLVTRFSEAKTALENARSQVDTLPTDDPAAFKTATDELGATIQTQLQAIGTALSALSQADLDAAANADPACQALGATTGG